MSDVFIAPNEWAQLLMPGNARATQIRHSTV